MEMLKLQKDFKMSKYINIVWTANDVQVVRPELTEEQCYQVLLVAKKEHDASVGINWDVLEIIADMLYPREAKVIEPIKPVEVIKPKEPEGLASKGRQWIKTKAKN
jgi:hypothetical protein